MEYRYFVKFSECKESVNYVKRRLKAQKLNVEQHDFENECCFIISAPAELLSTQVSLATLLIVFVCVSEIAYLMTKSTTLSYCISYAVLIWS